MHVVPDPRAVAGRVVGAGDPERHAVLLGQDHLAQGVAGARQLQARAHLGVGADRVEVAQGQYAEGPGGGDVGEHRLAHGLGAGVGAQRLDGGLLVHGQVVVRAVDRGGGAEDQAGAAVAQEMTDEVEALRHVRLVVAHRIRDRVRHHDQGRALDDRVDVGMLGEDAVHERAVRDVTLVEHAPFGELPPPRHQAVEDDRGDPGVQTGRGDRASDESGASGDQYLHSELLRRPMRSVLLDSVERSLLGARHASHLPSRTATSPLKTPTYAVPSGPSVTGAQLLS